MSGKQVRCLASVYQMRADLGLEAEDGHVPKKSSKPKIEKKTKRRRRRHSCCIHQWFSVRGLAPQRMSGNACTLGGHAGEDRVSSCHLVGRGRDVSKRPAMHRAAAHSKELSNPTRQLYQRWEADLKAASSNSNREDKTSGSSVPLLTSWF